MITILNSSIPRYRVLEILDFSWPKGFKVEVDYRIKEVKSYILNGGFGYWFKNNEDFIIEVKYGCKDQYPTWVERTNKDVKDGYLKRLYIESAELCLLYVLSHENRHMYQHVNDLFNIRYPHQTKKDKYDAEVDAEKYALKMVRKWRKLYEPESYVK